MAPTDIMIRYGKLHDPVIPPSVSRELARVGGRHPLYDVPLFRLVWGQKRLHWVGGKFENEIDNNGRRLAPHVATKQEPRYFGSNAERWILERWIPAACSQSEWYRTNEKWIDGVLVDQLGPYPDRGEYEEVISLPPEILTNPEFYQYVVQAVRMTQEISHSARRSHLLTQQEKKEQAWRADAEAILSDTPQSYLRPHIVVPQNYKGVINAS